MTHSGVRRACAVFAVAFTAVSSPFNAQAGQLPADLQKSLKSFSIASAAIDGGVLKVNVKRPTVTRDIYSSIISMGACLPLWNNARTGWGAASIKSIEVRNAIGAQGFAFRGGRKECDELGKVSGGDSAMKQYIDARTWVCVAGNECRPRRPGEVTAGDE
ncbi:hypothetical protein LFL97_00955 [Burkholderia sp. JSH-S8]|nr:hypothetical protein LFL97_00955 [Burkholderia sp. JSH-S8]